LGAEPDARRFDAGGPPLSEVGETEVLRRLVEIARETAGGLELAAGDDAAIWRAARDQQLALSQDAIVEGKDFRRDWTTPRQVGRKAMAVALSDLAGMGARPIWALATLCAPARTEFDDVLEIQRGLCGLASSVEMAVAGGDVSDIDGPIVVDVCVAGTLDGENCLRRDRATPGDALVVTGQLGRAAAGLRVLLETNRVTGFGDAARWVRAQLDPTPRLEEGRTLVALGVRAGGDISDGLLLEVERLARASRCGAEVWLDDVPHDPELESSFTETWPELTLGGGEEFELLAAVPQRMLDEVLGAWPQHLAPLQSVGVMTENAGVMLRDRRGGAPLEPPAVMSRHYG
jgi:thiamine-monophosphate kinase